MVHGILNVYKEKGYTSHDVVAKLRGIVGQKKIGHTGTLDPDATGVLPVCLGKATKVCDLLTDKDKTYRAILRLGLTTDTQDISGKVIEERDPEGLAEEAVRDALLSFVGDYEQVPPMYSALKVNGKKLYELAREGKTIERKSRPVHIYEIKIEEINLPRVEFTVTCSKGTYIRTLCHDLGEKLGVGACMEELQRIAVGRFHLRDALTLQEIREMKEEGTLEEVLRPVDSVFMQYPKMQVKTAYESLALNGNPLPQKGVTAFEGAQVDQIFRLYTEAGEFLALYKKTPTDYRIVKMFYVGE